MIAPRLGRRILRLGGRRRSLLLGEQFVEQLLDARGLHPVGLVGDVAFLIHDERHVRHAPEGVHHALVEIVDEHGHLHAEFLHHLLRVLPEVARLARVGFLGVDDEEDHVLILVFFLQILDAGHLPAVGGSRDGPELDHDVLLALEIGQVERDVFGGL